MRKVRILGISFGGEKPAAKTADRQAVRREVTIKMEPNTELPWYVHQVVPSGNPGEYKLTLRNPPAGYYDQLSRLGEITRDNSPPQRYGQ